MPSGSPQRIQQHRAVLVLIDLQQVVDVISYPNGRAFLARDTQNVATWFGERVGGQFQGGAGDVLA